MYNTNSQFKINTSMLQSSLCDYSDAYILVSWTIAITGRGANQATRQADEKNKGVIFKNCALLTDCFSNINKTQVDNAKDLDVAMPINNLIKYSDNFSRTSRSLWEYYWDEPNTTLADSEAFKSKVKITGSTTNDGNTKDVKVAVSLKYLSNLWRTFEMPLINCKINLILT